MMENLQVLEENFGGPNSYRWRRLHSNYDCFIDGGGFGYFSNEHGFSVESSLQRISSIFFVVETKRFVGSFAHVILTRQTCGQRSSRAAESKRRALGNYVSERICYMFLISICRVDGDSVHKRLENRTAMATSGKKTCFDAGKIGFCHCAAVLQTQVPKLYTDLDLGLLYILILGTYSKFTLKHNFLVLGVCFPQPCSSAGRRFAASSLRLQNYRRIVSFPQQKNR